MDSASIISWYFNCNSNQGRFSVLISDLISGKTSKRCCNSNPLFHPPSLLNCIEWITTGLVVFQTFPEFKQRRRNLRGCQGMTFYYELTGFLSSVGIPWKIFPSFDYSPLFSIIQGISLWNVSFKLTLTDRNMQVRFCLKVDLECWD